MLLSTVYHAIGYEKTFAAAGCFYFDRASVDMLQICLDNSAACYLIA